jgi:hypothetical protein
MLTPNSKGGVTPGCDGGELDAVFTFLAATHGSLLSFGPSFSNILDSADYASLSSISTLRFLVA